MRTRVAVCLLTLLVSQPVVGDDQKPDPDPPKRDLIGTWESVLPPDAPKSIRNIKHITPTHYTWVTYDADNDRILATSGGSCSVKGDRYEEVCEFATDSHQHVRGKTYSYVLKVALDKWSLRSSPDSDIAIDDSSNRIKPGDDQKTNGERIGRELLGTWESIQPPGSPKAMRTVKHVTPTHWTWVAYDRENKMVVTAAGGTWTIKDGKYEETCDFTTENFQHVRGKSFPYNFKVEGDRWTLNGGALGANQNDDVWTKVK